VWRREKTAAEKNRPHVWTVQVRTTRKQITCVRISKLHVWANSWQILGHTCEEILTAAGPYMMTLAGRTSDQYQVC
jgi:hypothetical protein